MLDIGLIYKKDAIDAVERCCPNTAMYRAIRDIPAVDPTEVADIAYGLGVCQGEEYAWAIAQLVFNSTMSFYEAKDVARCIKEQGDGSIYQEIASGKSQSNL